MRRFSKRTSRATIVNHYLKGSEKSSSARGIEEAADEVLRQLISLIVSHIVSPSSNNRYQNCYI